MEKVAPPGIGEWVACLIFVVGAVGVILKFILKIDGRYILKKEFEKEFEKELEAITEKLKAAEESIEEVRQMAKAEIEEVREETTREMSALRGEIHDMERRLMESGDKRGSVVMERLDNVSHTWNRMANKLVEELGILKGMISKARKSDPH